MELIEIKKALNGEDKMAGSMVNDVILNIRGVFPDVEIIKS
ncbi:MAG: hypothetical protein BWY78_00076 [Alphaproteobacteria bacterium ADurb.Bin438]|nr:MAG: hypothetical protein BWY78_00076 [Alphaproteobacteria bacterium ADurb.Bin438]